MDDPSSNSLSASRVKHMRDIGELARMKLDAPLYVHFDSDIISSDEAPAFHYPVRNGPSAGEVRDALARLARDGDIIATSMTCWAPELDASGETKTKCLAAYEALLAP